MRLDKYLAEAAQCTRSESREAIRSGRVSVNGAVCKRPEQQVNEMDSIQLDGKSRPRQAFVYIMLNKPAGVVSASSDRRDTTVVDLVRSAYPRRELFPAGRLDKTSTGFVLITDDGGFAHDILAPRRHVPKTYRVTLDTPLTGEMVEGFAAGVVLMDNVGWPPPRWSLFPRISGRCGWCCTRECTTRSSGCSACTAQGSTRCTGRPSAGWRWTRPWPPASGGN